MRGKGVILVILQKLYKVFILYIILFPSWQLGESITILLYKINNLLIHKYIAEK